jgi:hypothetical protein
MDSSAARTLAFASLAEADAKLAQLQAINPFLIDLSLRENPVGAPIGQTLADKLAILPRLRAFGFQNILLGTLDYSMPEAPEVDDQFMLYLRDNGIGMHGCYAFTAIGRTAAGGAFIADPSQLKLQAYGVPNTLHEIYLSDEGMAGEGYDLASLLRSLPDSIRWLQDNIRGDAGGPPRIIINIVDGCDAMAQVPERVFEVLELLARQPIEGVSIEDDRGTYLPFQVGAYVAAMRGFLPPPLRLMVHVHAGAGFENASVIEALLNGADGVWAALPKQAAVIGHASLGELIGNLVRVGNPNMQQYGLHHLLPLTNALQTLDDRQPLPDDVPIFGRNAYRLPLSFFRQKPGRFMDLVPEAIGGSYRYRVCPVVSDPAVIAGRLAEVTGEPLEKFSETLTRRMIVLMREDLRAGQRIPYDQPDELLRLLDRALSEPSNRVLINDV